MSKSSFHILRVGLAITFLWIGVLIFKHPEAWGGYLSSWVVELMPIPIREAMIGTAILDIAIGALLLVDSWVWLAALVGTAHLVIVLAVTGITDVTVRDIGIMAGMLALMIDSWPASPSSPRIEAGLGGPQNFIDRIKAKLKSK